MYNKNEIEALELALTEEHARRLQVRVMETNTGSIDTLESFICETVKEVYLNPRLDEATYLERLVEARKQLRTLVDFD